MKLTYLQVVQGAGSPAGGNAGGGGKLELDIKDLAGDPSDNTVGAAAVGLLAKTVGRCGQSARAQCLCSGQGQGTQGGASKRYHWI